jgi:hypothetical protein
VKTPFFRVLRKLRDTFISVGNNISLGSGDHQSIGSPGLYQGKIPCLYAVISRCVDKHPPTASRPLGSFRALCKGGKGWSGVLGSSAVRSMMLARKCWGVIGGRSCHCGHDRQEDYSVNSSKNFSASSAAIQPAPDEVIACL